MLFYIVGNLMILSDIVMLQMAFSLMRHVYLGGSFWIFGLSNSQV